MEDQLGLLAEICVGLAGFSSVIVVFRRGDRERWAPEDSFRFRIMLEAALFGAFFAILPPALAGLGVPAEQLWPVSSALLVAYLASNLARRWLEFRALPRGALNRGVAWFVGCASCFAIVVLLLGMAGTLVQAGPGPYTFAVSWLATCAGVTFYRLVTAPIEAESAARS